MRRDDIEEDNLRLRKQLIEQRDLLTQKRNEEDRLAAKMEKRKNVLSAIRRDKKMLRQEMNRKNAAARELESLISNLIDAERARKDRITQPPIIGKGLFEKRGRLRWPVEQGRVITHFGNREHPTLHTITQNTGIDIGLPIGSGVSAIAEGDVSTISWLPSFGNLIILDHQNGYRTVYAHLSDILVVEGQHVSEGASIGKSGESLAGPLLHFEIWKDREKQDPEIWLFPQGLARK
jgi:murein DD-endopeptidase MepM/ murein hydrolase activator NlpD